MPIFAVGINHKTAPLHLREQIYFPVDKLSLYLRDLLSLGLVQEAVLLSTCNRSELYCETADVTKARAWFCAQTNLPPGALDDAIYLYQDQKAVAHMMQVACGLDSMILGEPQILGQMKAAFSESCMISAVGASFHRLFQQIFATAKEIRTATAIGACPVSVASAAIHFVKQRIKNLETAHIVVIGAGGAGALLLKYLKSTLVKSITLVNRSLENASHLLLPDVNGRVLGIEQLSSALYEADVVFSATSSILPLISKRMIETVMRKRRKRPLLLIDLAVPRDIEVEVNEISQVSLFCIDDLKAIIETHHQGREHAAKKAREMIYEKSKTFILEGESVEEVTHTIRAYRYQIEEMCRSELAKAKKRLLQGSDPVLVLDAFAHAFTKKLLHLPSIRLRQAGAEGRFELLHLAKQLFALPDSDIERI